MDKEVMVCIHNGILLLLLSRLSCPTLCDPIDGSPPGSPVPGILQARTRVCCHFLLQCMKVKSESEVVQSCPTLCNFMDCSLPGSSVHGIFQARYYSAIKRSVFESVLMRWMNLEPIIQNEVSQKEKEKYHIYTYIRNLEKMIVKNLFTEQQ